MTDPEDLRLIRQFTKPIPSREIGLVYPSTELKKPLLKKLSEIIRKSVPKEMLSDKQETIIPI